ncbi:hypothetical protein ACFFWE_11180 [Sphaerisporangium melleum]|nr:hypothetical protein [Sphaerisporangium melleum]
MARFVAGSRFDRLLATGVLIAAGWLLGLVLGVFFAGPAAADGHGPAGQVAAIEADALGPPDAAASRRAPSASDGATGPAYAGGFPTVSVDAGAMAGRTVDGLTSQSKPVSPRPSTADHSAGANGIVPRGGSGPFGPGLGDVARPVFDPRFVVAPADPASVATPVVRAAADDPSFSPD